MTKPWARFLAYFLNGSSDLYLSRHWRDTRMAEHEVYTDSQSIPGMARIQTDVAEMRRRDFWDARAEREKPKLRIVRAGER